MSSERQDARMILVRGAVFGDTYRIESLLAEDPRRERYVATDVALDRRIVLELAWAADDPRSDRLLREVRAMARLAHPNIIAIHEVGVEQGRIYVAMELVDGRTVEAWLGVERSWRAVLSVFTQAACGLAAAHRVGLVHGALGPSNVLVGTDGRVRVTGFGADAAEDRDGDRQAFFVALQHALPARVPAWVRALVRRGLRTTPDGGFADMQAVEIALRDDPTRRRRALGAGIGLVALGVSAWVGLLFDESRRAAKCATDADAIRSTWSPQAQQTLHDALLATGLSFAESTFEYARPVVDAYVERWHSAYVDGCVAATVEHTQESTRWDASRACLDDRRVALEMLLDVLSTDTNASAVEEAAEAVLGLPPLDACDDDRWLARHPPNGAHEREDLRARLWRASALRDAGLHAAGRELVERILAEAGPDDVEIRIEASLVAGDIAVSTGSFEAGAKLAGDAFDLALAAGDDHAAFRAAVDLVDFIGTDLMRFDEAERWSGIARDLLQRVGGTGGLMDAVLHTNVGNTWTLQSRYEQAERAHAVALAIREQRLGPDHPLCGASLSNLGLVYHKMDRLAKAEQAYMRALSIGQRAFGPEHPDLATMHNNIAALLLDQGRYDAAASHAVLAVELIEHAHGPEHPMAAAYHTVLAAIRHAQGQYEDAARTMETALAIREKALGTDHLLIASSHHNLGVLYGELMRFDAAERELTAALAGYTKALGSDHDATVVSHLSLGQLYLRLGRYAESERAFSRALAIAEKNHGALHTNVADAHHGLGSTAMMLGRLKEAEQHHRQALAVHENVLGLDHPDVGGSHSHLGIVYTQQARYADAEREQRRALTIHEKHHGPGHPATMRTLVLLTHAELDAGHLDEALKHAERAAAALETHAYDPDVRAGARFALARARWSAGQDRASAVTLAQQARQDLAAAPAMYDSRRTDIDRWLATHRVAR